MKVCRTVLNGIVPHPFNAVVFVASALQIENVLTSVRLRLPLFVTDGTRLSVLPSAAVGYSTVTDFARLRG